MGHQKTIFPKLYGWFIQLSGSTKERTCVHRLKVHESTFLLWENSYRSTKPYESRVRIRKRKLRSPYFGPDLKRKKSSDAIRFQAQCTIEMEQTCWKSKSRDPGIRNLLVALISARTSHTSRMLRLPAKLFVHVKALWSAPKIVQFCRKLLRAMK